MILHGVRILSFTTGIAGPNAGRILATLGAEVIKVESRAGGIDAFRYFGTGDDLNTSARFAEANLGVRSITANLKHPEGRDLVRRLAIRSDVVLENYRPDVLDRLGLGYDALVGDRPDIIVVKMPGLGSTGPLAGYGTWGALLNAYSGLTALWNHPDQDVPVGNQGVFPDYLSSVLAPMVVVSALLHRDATGTGTKIDLAQSEATAFCALPVSFAELGINGVDPSPVGNRTRDDSLQGVYPCAGNDRWCAIRVEGDAAWSALLGVLGDAELASDPANATVGSRRSNQDAIDAAISAWTVTRDPHEVMRMLQAAGVAAGVVATGDDLLRDPQLARPGFIRRFEQPGIGEMIVPGLPLSITPPLMDEPPPARMLGEDTAAVLREVLELSDAEIDRLTVDGVLA